jgi:hypothetical protein
MKNYKRADWIVQLMLMSYIILHMAITQEATILFAGYFVVGGWQLISMLLHEYAGSFTAKGSRRRYYHNSVYIILLIALTGILIPQLLLIFYLLLYISPFMAIWYTYLCFDETEHHMRRPLSQLK